MNGWKREVFKAIGYQPFAAQIPIHESNARVIGISGGEDSGKSIVTAAEAVGRMPFMLCHVYCPRYMSGKKEVQYMYEYLNRWGLTNKNLFSDPKDGKWSIGMLNGGRIESISTEDGTKAITGTGESPDLVLFVEAGKQSYEAFKAALLRSLRLKAPFLLSGTPEASEDWYPDLIASWKGDNVLGAEAFILPTWANEEHYPLGMDDPAIQQAKATLTESEFLARMGGETRKPPELVIPEFDYTVHVSEKARYDVNLPTELFIDPGYSGSYYSVLVAQFPDPSTCWVVDEIYSHFATHEQVIEAAQTREWWWKVKHGVIDIAGSYHQGASVPATKIWGHAGKLLRYRRVLPEDGINLHRTMLRQGRIHINPKCAGMLVEYRKWKRKNVGGIFTSPSDQNCDAMKAMHYGLFDHYGALAQAHERVQRRAQPNPYAAILEG